MKIRPFLALICGLTFIMTLVLKAEAQKLDQASEDALKDTKKLLTTPAERAKAIKGNQQAEEANRKAESIGGSPQNTQQIYNISADVFDKMIRDSGGDSTKVQEQLLKAQGNPEAFFKNLSPEQRAAIEKLAKDIATRQSSGDPAR